MKMVNLKVWTAGETANNFQRFLRFCLSQCVSFEKIWGPQSSKVNSFHIQYTK